MKGRCCCCENMFEHTELDDFTIPDRTCAVTHAVTIGDAYVLMCKKCQKERGTPVDRYLGRISYEKPKWQSGPFVIH